MKESNTLAKFAAIKQPKREILNNTKSLYMIDSNTLANNAAIKQLKRDILKNIKSQGMKSQIPLQSLQLSSSYKQKS